MVCAESEAAALRIRDDASGRPWLVATGPYYNGEGISITAIYHVGLDH